MKPRILRVERVSLPLPRSPKETVQRDPDDQPTRRVRHVGFALREWKLQRLHCDHSDSPDRRGRRSPSGTSVYGGTHHHGSPGTSRRCSLHCRRLLTLRPIGGKPGRRRSRRAASLGAHRPPRAARTKAPTQSGRRRPWGVRRTHHPSSNGATPLRALHRRGAGPDVPDRRPSNRHGNRRNMAP